MDPADLGLDASTLASIPGLGGILLHGQDFFDRPSGTLIPQFAAPLASYLDGQTLVGTSNSSTTDTTAQAGASAQGPNPPTLDYDHFSDRVDSQPAPSAYDQFSDAVPNNLPRSVGGLFFDAVASSQVGRDTSDDSSGAVASDGAPRSVGGLFSDAVASSQVERDTQSEDSNTSPVSQIKPARSWWNPSPPTPDAMAEALEVARADPLYRDPAKYKADFETLKQLPGNIDDAVRVAANDITFGGADYLAAYANSSLDNGDFKTSLHEEQARTANANPTAAKIGHIVGFLGEGAAATKLGNAGFRLVGDRLVPYAARYIPQLGRWTAEATEAGSLVPDAKLAIGATEDASGSAGAVAATNPGDAVGTEALLSRGTGSAAGAANGTAGEAAASDALAATSEPAQATAAGEGAGAPVTADSARATDAAAEGGSTAEASAANNASNTNRGLDWSALSRSEKRAIKDRLTNLFKDSKEVVYQFTSNGLKYVGQTSRGFQRIVEHLYKGKLHPDDIESILFKDTPGGKFAREYEERRTIEAAGGLAKTANKILPVSDARLSSIPPAPSLP